MCKRQIHPLALLESTAATLSLIAFHQIHAQLLTSGLLNSPHPLGKFIAALALSQKTPHLLAYSHQVLCHHADPTTFAVNALLRAHSKGPTPHLCFPLFRLLLLRCPSLAPDHFSLAFLVRASAGIPSAASAVHAAAAKLGLACDPHVQSGLIHAYADPIAARRVYDSLPSPDLVSQTAMIGALAATGEISSARHLFDGMPHRDHVAWNAMIAGYASTGRSRFALELFGAMQSEGARVTEATMTSVLTACSQLGALNQGKWAHTYIQKHGIRTSPVLGTALIDMYSKCGDTGRATEVFHAMNEKNVYTWSSMIGGLAMNGAVKECLELFTLMREEGVAPNEITFISLLRGCSVAGLVDEGCKHFDSMRNCYGIEPWIEHYGCMVDLYSRAGQLDEAIGFIKSMPIDLHVEGWGALLNACKIHRNTKLGEYAMRKIVEIDSSNEAAYVLLSNIYADSRDWKGVSRVRELMKANGVRKEPGCSVIEVRGQVHEFFVRDRSHPKYREIEVMLHEMSRRLRSAGFVARTNEVLFDIQDEEKEDSLCWHSEKLAIAFGLIALEGGAIIRIVKNLRTCWDCHDATKFISKLFEREIVVRDRNRFHHFKDGACSCMDFW